VSSEKNQRDRDDQDIHSTPWFGLAYLLFLYLPLVFWQNRPASAVIASLIATVLFVPAHFASYRVQTGATSVALVLFVAALAYALIPFNPGGNTLVIYAVAMAAATLSAGVAIRLSVAMVAVMAVEFWWVMPRPIVALAYVAIVAVIGTMVVAGILYSRARGRRNAELRLTQDEVRRLATLAERERIGRDLHDLLGHTLSVVAIKSELAGKLLDRDPAAARAQIREVEHVARQALAQVREAVAGIRAAGFQAELAAARLALLSAEVRLDQRLAPIEVGGDVETVLAMTLREAVTNVLRHAQAARVEVELGEHEGSLRLTIADDGRGGIESHGNGLAGMRERLVAIGGTLEIDSPPGAGTRLLIRAPCAVKR
jgi:two-component system, NarL family, sensor histidine kinase DesK